MHTYSMSPRRGEGAPPRAMDYRQFVACNYYYYYYY